MDMKLLIDKMDQLSTGADAVSENSEISEAYINSAKDVIQILGNLRKMGKQGELGGQTPPGFAGQVVNDLWDVMVWIEQHMNESVTNEAGPADEPDHKDGDQDDKRWDDAEEADKDKVNEGIVIQADGNEAMALLDMLKLAGRPAPQPVMSGGCGMTEEDDPTYSNTPDEEVADMSAATPSGNDMHREKGAWRAAAGADNPMVAAMEGKLSKMFETLNKE